MFALLFLVTEV